MQPSIMVNVDSFSQSRPRLDRPYPYPALTPDLAKDGGGTHDTKLPGITSKHGDVSPPGPPVTREPSKLHTTSPPRLAIPLKTRCPGCSAICLSIRVR